jgi:hypothetical protein
MPASIDEVNSKQRNGKSLSGASILASSLLSGVALLLIVNCFLWTLSPLSSVDPESLPSAHTWVWWATHEYLGQRQTPSVVLLGSSLMMHPISRLDADTLNTDLDYVHHHYSKYIGDAIDTRLGTRQTNCFNFALPGGMVSDDYMITRALFHGEKKPRIIVLGLSLRDFIDNGVHCAASTPAFKYLQRYTQTDDLVDISMPQIWQQLDYWQGKCFYLWGKKLDLQVVLSQATKSYLAPLAGRYLAASKLNDLDPARNLPSNLRSEVEEGMFIVKTHQAYSFEDNSQEYIKRYRNGNSSLFAIQTKFLDKLMMLAQSENIKVVIVNMPLTPTNMSLMPPGYYQKYLATLNTEAGRYGAPLIDLNGNKTFVMPDFYDTSHMNSQGGKKLADAIISTLSGNQTLAQALINGHDQSQLAAHGHTY